MSYQCFVHNDVQFISKTVNTHDLERIPKMISLAKLCSTVVIIKESVPFSEVKLWKGLPKEFLLMFNHLSCNILMHMDSTICEHIMYLHIVYQSACQVYFASNLSIQGLTTLQQWAHLLILLL